MANVIAGSGKRIQIVDRVRVIEQKTGHERNIYVTDKMKDILYEHIKNRAISEGGVNLSAPLILSRKRTVDKTPKALSRQHISSVINKAAKKVGIRGSIGTHGLRKTFVFQAWKQNISVDVLQKILGHSSVEVTHRYACIPIGYEQETYNKINYGHNSSRKYTRKRNGILP
jgi:integrase